MSARNQHIKWLTRPFTFFFRAAFEIQCVFYTQGTCCFRRVHCRCSAVTCASGCVWDSTALTRGLKPILQVEKVVGPQPRGEQRLKGSWGLQAVRWRAHPTARVEGLTWFWWKVSIRGKMFKCACGIFFSEDFSGVEIKVKLRGWVPVPYTWLI